MVLAIPEHRVQQIWEDAIQHRADLITEDNQPIRIIYPGRPNDGRGADLRDVVIETSQGIFRGDIEFHVTSDGWRAHHHHEDPNYNPVILHVVYKNGAGRETILKSGVAVPVLALHGYSQEQPGYRLTSVFTHTSSSLPCLNIFNRADQELLIGLIEEAGIARFYCRSADFKREICSVGPGQTLYRGIMEALGYSHNKISMVALANAVPLAELEKITTSPLPDDVCLMHLQAWLLGAAGLLPGQRRTKAVAADEIELEKLWDIISGEVCLSAEDWQFFKVRPGNYPTRRIAAMSYLLARYRKQGILNGLQAILEFSTKDGGLMLDKALLVDTDAHKSLDTDTETQSGRTAALLGRERVAEIIINVVLPFYATQLELTDRTINIYSNYKSPSDNSLVKHMRKQFGLPQEMIKTAQRQQGLIYIYKTMCTQGRCNVCPVGWG